MVRTGRCTRGFLALCSGLLLLAGPALAAFPFAEGEEIRYQVRWQQAQVGEALVRVLPETQGQAAWHFELSMNTLPFLDPLIKVHDRLRSVAAKDLSGSLEYAVDSTGTWKKQIRVFFSRNPARVVYRNFDEVREPLEIPPGAFDPLASFYKMRTLDFEATQPLSFPVSDGKKAFVQTGQVQGRETLVLDSGTWQTLVLDPRVTHFSGVFEKSPDARVRVWISEDARRIPVRIRIKVRVGSIYFDLAGFRPGGAVSPAGPGPATRP